MKLRFRWRMRPRLGLVVVAGLLLVVPSVSSSARSQPTWKWVLPEDAPAYNKTGLDLWRSTSRGVVHLTHPGWGGADSAPAWSPDGRYVAFNRAGQGKGPGLYVLDTADRPYQWLVPGEVANIVWAPDGRSIAFANGQELEVVGA